MHWWNKNVFGTHFGGSLYAMIDPWYCLMLVANLGKDYVIWDKAATIRFLNPGVGTVTAKFRLTEDVIRRIKEEADREGRCQPTFKVEILDAAGKVVADADKVISVRRKDKIKARTAAAKHVAEKNLPHH
ncbi:hypothetical protein BV898_17821 [Hypsibius exemplaris]|uniref:Uncharacterized protein n=1 Tax=Hypsibius exemplaris TaxID=2072580 RepID=A0A9X6RN71_HYPEX|nr:hypothetical protein BV898_17821 [Hypsibius exemplaris]